MRAAGIRGVASLAPVKAPGARRRSRRRPQQGYNRCLFPVRRDLRGTLPPFASVRAAGRFLMVGLTTRPPFAWARDLAARRYSRKYLIRCDATSQDMKRDANARPCLGAMATLKRTATRQIGCARNGLSKPHRRTSAPPPQAIGEEQGGIFPATTTCAICYN